MIWSICSVQSCPAREVGAAIIMPAANAEAMNQHLKEISAQVQPDAHAALICDGAGWHQRGKKLMVPANITLISLPPLFTRTQLDGERLALSPCQQVEPAGVAQLRGHRRRMQGRVELSDQRPKPHQINRNSRLGVGQYLRLLVSHAIASLKAGKFAWPNSRAALAPRVCKECEPKPSTRSQRAADLPDRLRKCSGSSADSALRSVSEVPGAPSCRAYVRNLHVELLDPAEDITEAGAVTGTDAAPDACPHLRASSRAGSYRRQRAGGEASTESP